MKTIKLTDNGKEMEVQISEESWEALRKSVQNKVWKPHVKEKCYIVSQYGDALEWTPFSSDTRDALYDFGNCFKTEKEAEAHRDWLQFWADYRRWSAENGNEGGTHIIFYDDSKKVLSAYRHVIVSNDLGSMSFTTEELAEKFIEDIGEDRIKKFMEV